MNNFSVVRESINNLQSNIVVKLIIDDIVEKAELICIQRCLSKMEGTKEESRLGFLKAKSNWANKSKLLSKENHQLIDNMESINTEIPLIKEKLKKFNIEIEKFIEEEELLRKQSEFYSSFRDLSSLAPKAKQKVLSFLTISDLTHSIMTCNAWRVALDTHQSWKTVILYLERRRRRVQVKNRKFPLQSMTLTLPNTHKLKQEKIFQKCLKQLKQTLEKAQNEQQTLELKKKTSEEETLVLSDQKDYIQQQLGLSMLKKSELKKNSSDILDIKNKLANELGNIESILKETQKKHSDLLFQFDKELYNHQEKVKNLETCKTESEESTAITKAKIEKDMSKFKSENDHLLNIICNLKDEVTNSKKLKENNMNILKNMKNQLKVLMNLSSTSPRHH